MPRGQPPNLLRQAAREAGHKTYIDSDCWVCGSPERYAVNGQCVECAITNGKARYRRLTPEQLVAVKQRDHTRYKQRKGIGHAEAERS